jgi:hypothetical protein
MTIRERGNVAGSVASCGNDNAAEQRRHQPPTPSREKGKNMSKRKRRLGTVIVHWTRELPTEPGDYLFSSTFTRGITILTIAKSKQGVLVCANAKNMSLPEFSEMVVDGMWSSSKIEVPK